jgi:hypothetical protein
MQKYEADALSGTDDFFYYADEVDIRILDLEAKLAAVGRVVQDWMDNAGTEDDAGEWLFCIDAILADEPTEGGE